MFHFQWLIVFRFILVNFDVKLLIDLLDQLNTPSQFLNFYHLGQFLAKNFQYQTFKSFGLPYYPSIIKISRVLIIIKFSPIQETKHLS